MVREAIPRSVKAGLVHIRNIPMDESHTYKLKRKFEDMGCSLRSLATRTRTEEDGNSWAIAAFNEAFIAERCASTTCVLVLSRTYY
jgi:hypothetical protein